MNLDTYFIGIDLGKQSSYFVVQDASGAVQTRMKIFNNAKLIGQALKPYQSFKCRAVMESTCNYYWMYRTLRELGIHVVLAHPLKTRAIADAKIKNDRLDARILADLLRANLIPQSYIPSEEIRLLREMTRQHIRLVRIRTRIKNQCHSLLTKLNIHPPKDWSDLFGQKGKQWLSKMELPPVFEFQKQQLLSQINYYNNLIQQIDRKIQNYLKTMPASEILRSIPGIGMFASAMILAEIGAIDRFHSPQQLASYAGLVPGLYESGQTSRSRGITHEGNKFLRWILCEVTHRHIRKAGPLREFYLRLKAGKGHGKALVATTRKFLTYIYFALKGQKTILSTYFAG